MPKNLSNISFLLSETQKDERQAAIVGDNRIFRIRVSPKLTQLRHLFWVEAEKEVLR